MPPKHVGEELREIIKKVRDGSFEYEHREKGETNWAKYDFAQIKEMGAKTKSSLTLGFS